MISAHSKPANGLSYGTLCVTGSAALLQWCPTNGFGSIDCLPEEGQQKISFTFSGGEEKASGHFQIQNERLYFIVNFENTARQDTLAPSLKDFFTSYNFAA